MQKRYSLLVDHYSTFKSTHRYAGKGETVIEVVDHGNFLIVEDKNGERFSVPANILEEINDEKPEQSANLPVTSAPLEDKQPKVPARKASKHSGSTSQANLF